MTISTDSTSHLQRLPKARRTPEHGPGPKRPNDPRQPVDNTRQQGRPHYDNLLGQPVIPKRRATGSSTTPSSPTTGTPTAIAAGPDAYDPTADEAFISTLKDALGDLARDAEKFDAFIDGTFGPVDPKVREGLRQKILDRQWDTVLPTTEVVDFDMPGVNGAYSPEQSTVYLQAAGTPNDVQSTYLEELGHHFHNLLSATPKDALHDNLGDEGRIFALQFERDGTGTITGINPDTVIPDELRRENDVGQIAVAGPDGRRTIIEVEFDGEPFDATGIGTPDEALAAIVESGALELIINAESDADFKSGVAQLQGILRNVFTHWNTNYDRGVYQSLAASLQQDLLAQLLNQRSPGFSFTPITRNNPIPEFHTPSPASSGFSGPDRSDKTPDLGEDWLDNRLPDDTSGSATIEIRSVELDYANTGLVQPRRPSQTGTMATVAGLQPFVNNHNVSPNDYLGTPLDTVPKNRSSEWLHMSASSDGDNVRFNDTGHDNLFPAEIDNRPQDPRNLVAGSYGANTMMIALERAGQSAPNKAEFKKTVKAYALLEESGDYDPHKAHVIEYTITHKETGRSRTYLINAEKGSYASLADYMDMERDAAQFFEADHSSLPQESTYAYLSDKQASRLMDANYNAKQMRIAVEAERILQTAADDPALRDVANQHRTNNGGDIKYRLDNDSSRVVSWDATTQEIVIGLDGNDSLLKDPARLKGYLALGMLDAQNAPQINAAWAGATSSSDYADRMMQIEYDTVSKHQKMFGPDHPSSLFVQSWDDLESYKRDNPESVNFYKSQKTAGSQPPTAFTARRTFRPVFEPESPLIDLHSDLMENSKTYRSLVEEATRKNPGLQVKIGGVEGDRTARYDLDSNTIYLKDFDVSDPARVHKRMADLAFEMANASQRDAFQNVIDQARDPNINMSADVFASRILDIEYESGKKALRISDELRAFDENVAKAVAPTYSLPGTAFKFRQQQSKRRKTSSGAVYGPDKPSLMAFYKGQFDTVKNGGSLEIWKPRKDIVADLVDRVGLPGDTEAIGVARQEALARTDVFAEAIADGDYLRASTALGQAFALYDSLVAAGADGLDELEAKLTRIFDNDIGPATEQLIGQFHEDSRLAQESLRRAEGAKTQSTRHFYERRALSQQTSAVSALQGATLLSRHAVSLANALGREVPFDVDASSGLPTEIQAAIDSTEGLRAETQAVSVELARQTIAELNHRLDRFKAGELSRNEINKLGNDLAHAHSNLVIAQGLASNADGGTQGVLTQLQSDFENSMRSAGVKLVDTPSGLGPNQTRFLTALDMGDKIFVGVEVALGVAAVLEADGDPHEIFDAVTSVGTGIAGGFLAGALFSGAAFAALSAALGPLGFVVGLAIGFGVGFAATATLQAVLTPIFEVTKQSLFGPKEDLGGLAPDSGVYIPDADFYAAVDETDDSFADLLGPIAEPLIDLLKADNAPLHRPAGFGFKTNDLQSMISSLGVADDTAWLLANEMMNRFGIDTEVGRFLPGYIDFEGDRDKELDTVINFLERVQLADRELPDSYNVTEGTITHATAESLFNLLEYVQEDLHVGNLAALLAGEGIVEDGHIAVAEALVYHFGNANGDIIHGSDDYKSMVRFLQTLPPMSGVRLEEGAPIEYPDIDPVTVNQNEAAILYELLDLDPAEDFEFYPSVTLSHDGSRQEGYTAQKLAERLQNGRYSPNNQGTSKARAEAIAELIIQRYAGPDRVLTEREFSAFRRSVIKAADGEQAFVLGGPTQPPALHNRLTLSQASTLLWSFSDEPLAPSAQLTEDDLYQRLGGENEQQRHLAQLLVSAFGGSPTGYTDMLIFLEAAEGSWVSIPTQTHSIGSREREVTDTAVAHLIQSSPGGNSRPRSRSIERRQRTRGLDAR